MHRRLPDGVGFGVPSDLAIFSVRDQFLSAKHAVISGHHSADGRFKVISTHECSVFSFACLDLVPLPATYELILALAINVERVEAGGISAALRASLANHAGKEGHSAISEGAAEYTGFQWREGDGADGFGGSHQRRH